MSSFLLNFIQLFFVLLFLQNSNCAQTKDIELIKNFKISSLIAKCLKDNSSAEFDYCYKFSATNIQNDISKDIPFQYENLKNSTDFNLYCRNAHKFMIEIDHLNISKADERYVYMLMAEESSGKYLDRLMFFSDKKLINVTLEEQSSKESTTLSYNISAYIISSNGVVQMLGTKKFTLLPEDYRPENIKNIYQKNIQENYNETEGEILLDLTVGWNSGNDQTCSYLILIFSDNINFEQIPVPMDKLYEYTFENIKPNDLFNIAVLGINSHNPEYYSSPLWNKFDYLNNFKVTATPQHKSGIKYDVNIAWTKLRYKPAYFKILIRSRTSLRFDATVKGDEDNYYFKNIDLEGSYFFLKITSFNDKDKQVSEYSKVIKTGKLRTTRRYRGNFNI